jgi:hypothetical protein
LEEVDCVLVAEISESRDRRTLAVAWIIFCVYSKLETQRILLAAPIACVSFEFSHWSPL